MQILLDDSEQMKLMQVVIVLPPFRHYSTNDLPMNIHAVCQMFKVTQLSYLFVIHCLTYTYPRIVYEDKLFSCSWAVLKFVV